MQIDVLKYAALKKAGRIQLVKMGGTPDGVDGAAVAFVQKFDPDHGTPLQADAGPVNLEHVLMTRKTLQTQIDGVDALLSDMKALKVPTELPPAEA